MRQVAADEVPSVVRSAPSAGLGTALPPELPPVVAALDDLPEAIRAGILALVEASVRWTDRIWPDGTWTANLFQFYRRVVHRLTVDLKIPFQLQPGMVRKDDTLVHEAIRETFVNAIIHADFPGQGGIIVEKYRDRFEFSNPGTLLLSVEQIL